MPTNVMPASRGRGAKNHVPQPKPRHVPDGCHRCPTCNGLVKDGDECGCSKPDVTYMREVRKRYVEPTKREYEKARGATKKEPRVYTFRNKSKERREQIDKGEKQRPLIKCETCGQGFYGAGIGRTPRFCEECRKERHREQWRARSRSRA